MKTLLSIFLTFLVMPGLLVAGDTLTTNEKTILKHYEIDFEFLDILFSRYLVMYEISTDEVLPRVNPRGLVEVLDIHVVDDDQVIIHGIYLNRHILTAELSAKDHGKLKNGYREMLNEEITTLSEDEFLQLSREDRKKSADRKPAKAQTDPFAETKDE